MTFVMLSVFSSGIQPKLEIPSLLTINVACYMWLLINHSRLCVLQNTFQGLKKVGTTQSAQCCVPLLGRNETKEPWWSLSSGCQWEITCQAIRSLSLFSFSVSSGWCLIYSSVKKALDKIINKYRPSFWQVKKSSINPQSPAGDHNIGHQRGEEHAWSSARCCWW